MKGGGLVGARSLLVAGAPGVSATLAGGAAQVDEGARPLFQAKCTTCHEPRSPANRSLSPEQWASTVDRMIQHGADISGTDKTRIVGYLQALAKAGEMKIHVAVAPNAAPGPRELRIVTSQGVSTAYQFEVGTLPETNAPASGNDTPEKAAKLALPTVVNGIVTGSGQRQYFSFDAKKGQQLTFSLRAYRINEESAAYFNPVLYLYDAAGNEVGKDLGRIGTDPVLDWTAPADGTYTLLVRDLIWKGSPSSVYRLVIGPGTENGVPSPAVAAPGSEVAVRLMPAPDDNAVASGATPATFSVRVPDSAMGLTMIDTPMGGEVPILVRDLPDGGGPGAAGTVALPALFHGVIQQAGQSDTFRVHAPRAGGSLEVFARRLGSPLRPQVTVTNARGRVIASRVAIGDDDLRITNAFPAPGNYTVTVTDGDGNGGAAYAYNWESRDGGVPDFSLTLAPDVVNLPPGGSSALVVHLGRRGGGSGGNNVPSPITLSVTGLPSGVTAGQAILLPGATDAAIPISAAPTATVTAAPITIEGTARDDSASAGTDSAAVTRRRARPLEVYRVNNVPNYVPRAAAVVAVTADPPPFTLTVVSGADAGGIVRIAPGGEVKIVVHVARPAGGKGEVQLVPMGLPPGITGPGNVDVKGNQTEATVTLHANGDVKYLSAPPAAGSTPPAFVIGGYVGGTGFGGYDGAPAAATPALTLGAAAK